MARKNKKITKTVRLYQVHDMDLVTYMFQHGLDIEQAIYISLKSLVNGKHVTIQVPPYVGEEGFLTKKYKHEIAVRLDPVVDRDILDLLDKIKKGRINNFIKNTLRMYLAAPISESFLEDNSTESMELISKINGVFREGKEELIINSGYYYSVPRYNTQSAINKNSEVVGVANNKSVKETMTSTNEGLREKDQLVDTERVRNQSSNELVQETTPQVEATYDNSEETSGNDISDMFGGIVGV